MARTPHRKDRQGGFTIIETMLAMAVGAFIIMIVLMAVPALERSSRNNQRKEDVQTILGAVLHYKLSNSGSMPDSSSNFLKYAKLTYYSNTVQYIAGGVSPTHDGINVYSETPTTAKQTERDTLYLDEVDVHNYRKCDNTDTSNVGGSTNLGAGFGDVVALYAVEAGANHIEPQCQQL